MSSLPLLSLLRNGVSRRPLFVVLAAAAVLRIGVVCWKFENLSTDTDSYLVIAGNILAGEGFCSVAGRPTAFRPPLYPILVAVCKISGETTGFGGTIGLAAMQIFLGTATCGLAWGFASRLKLSERARLLAAVAVAVDPLLLLYASHAMTETLVTFLVTLLLVVVAGARSSRNSVLTGVVFGLAVLCRPSLWAFGALAAGCFLIRVVRKKPEVPSRREALRSGILVAISVLLTVAPWAIRNAMVFGRPLLMTTHGGYTLLLANNPVFYEQVVERGQVWSAQSLQDWQAHIDQIISVQGVSQTDELARDAAMREMAWKHIRQQPGRFARSCLTRALRFWSFRPQAGAASWSVRLAVSAWYLAVLSVFAVGLVRIRVIGHDALPAVLLIVSLTGVHAVFWSNARMRAPVTVAVASIAASVVFPRNATGGRTLESV